MGTSSSKEEPVPLSIERFSSRVPPSLIRREMNGYFARDDFYARSWAGLKVALNNLKTSSTRSNLSLKPTENIPFISFSNINFILTHFSTLETGFTKTPNNGFFISVRTHSPIVSNIQETTDPIDLLDWYFSNTDNQNLFKLSHPQRHLDCKWDDEFSAAGGWERQKGHYINHVFDLLLLLKRRKEIKSAPNSLSSPFTSMISMHENELQTTYNHNSSSTVYNNDYELNSHIIDLNYNDTNTNFPSQHHSYTNNTTKTNTISSSLKWNSNSGGGCGLNGLNYDNLYSKTRLRYQFLLPSSLNTDLKRLRVEGVVSCIVADIFISDEEPTDPYYDLDESTESFFPKDPTRKHYGGIKEDYMEVIKKRIQEANKKQKNDDLKKKNEILEENEENIEKIKPKDVVNSDSSSNLIYIGKVLFITKNINGNNVTHIFYWLGCHDILEDNLISTTSLNSPHANNSALNNDSTLAHGKKSEKKSPLLNSSSNFNKASRSFFSSSRLESNLTLARDLYEYSAEWMACMREFLPSYVNQHYIKEQNLQYEYYQQQEELLKEMNQIDSLSSLKSGFNFSNLNNISTNAQNQNDNLDTIYENEQTQSGYSSSQMNSSNNHHNSQSATGSSLVSLAPSIAFQQQQQFFNSYQGEDPITQEKNGIIKPKSEYDLYQVAYHVPDDFGY